MSLFISDTISIFEEVFIIKDCASH